MGRIETDAVREAIERAFRRTLRENEQRRNLRAGLRLLREALQDELYVAMVGDFSHRVAADGVFELLLELDCLDLVGVAEIVGLGDDKQIRAARRRYRRQQVRPHLLVPKTSDGK